MKTKFPILAIMTITLTTGCKDNYLGGLIQVGTHNAAEVTTDEYKVTGKRDTYWGECDYWKDFSFVSNNDVDTAWNKLNRHQVVDPDTIPEGNDHYINRQIAKHWAEHDVNPGLSYVMRPRRAVLDSRGHEQKGLVAFQITKNNQMSYIDVAYCVGPSTKLGFYIPHTIADRFEPDLKAKFKAALR